MTWTFEVEGQGASAEIRNPEFGDQWTDQARVASFSSDGGQVFSQDLSVVDEFLNAGWRDLSDEEWSRLRRVLRAASLRVLPLRITIDSPGKPFPVPLQPGLTVDGQPLSLGQVPCGWEDGIGAGDTVNAEGAILSGVFLEQSSLSLEHRRHTQSDLLLVFRIRSQSAIQAGG